MLPNPQPLLDIRAKAISLQQKDLVQNFHHTDFCLSGVLPPDTITKFYFHDQDKLEDYRPVAL